MRRSLSAVVVSVALVGSAALMAVPAITPPAGAAATAPLTASVGDASVVEGNRLTRQVYFTVALSRPSTVPVTVVYSIGPNGSAVAGSCATPGTDFSDGGGGLVSLNFPVLATGVTAASRQIAVKVCGDTTPETDETFVVALWGVNSGYSLTRNVGTGTIIDDDTTPGAGVQVSIGDASLREGDSAARTLKFALTLSAPSPTPVTVGYVVTSGTASCGSSTNVSSDCWDYGGTTRSVTFPAGSVARSVTTTVFADRAYEGDESFTVHLANPLNASVFRAIGTGTILNDDTACNNGASAPAQYKHVVVFAFENRSWQSVGGEGFGSGLGTMPYFHNLAQSCSYFSSWSEADLTQSSMTQYTAQVTGALQPNLVNNCAPSATCSTTADNIFRQARVAGKTAINYVEGATTGCQAGSIAGPHTIGLVQTVPAMYLWSADDRANCLNQVRPYSEFDPSNLPDFSFITPTPCSNGHDFDTCGTNAAVNAWAATNMERVLQSQAYARGEVFVSIWYDEDSPVPNLQIAPTAVPGPFATSGVGYGSTLRAWQDMLGLPCLADACTSPDMRTVAGF